MEMPNKNELAEKILGRWNYHYIMDADDFITHRNNMVREFTKKELLKELNAVELIDKNKAYWNRLIYVNKMDHKDFYKMINKVAEGKQEEDDDDEPYYNMFPDEIIMNDRRYGPLALWATYPYKFEKYMNSILEKSRATEILRRFFSR